MGELMSLRAVLVAFALLAVSCSPRPNAQTLSPSDFRDAVASAIAKQHPQVCIEKPGPSTITFGLNRQACNAGVMSTDYVYRQYADDPLHLEVYVRGLTTAASSSIETLNQKPFQPDPSRLVVVIRPAVYASTLRTDKGDGGGIWRPFVGDLIAVLVQKDAELSRSLTAAQLKSVGLTESQAWELALRNLRGQIGPLQRSANDQGAEVVTASSGLATSSLWLPEACSAGVPDFDAFVVTRDTYFYADQRKPEATSRLAGYVVQLLQSGEQTYSERLISCSNGHWYASKFDGKNAWRPVEDGS
jgi:hypothetical protein